MVFDESLKGFYGQELQLKDPFPTKGYGSCNDLDTLVVTWSLWKLINAKIVARGAPLPPALSIKPDMVDLWNTIKGAIDDYDKIMANAESDIQHLVS